MLQHLDYLLLDERNELYRDETRLFFFLLTIIHFCMDTLRDLSRDSELTLTRLEFIFFPTISTEDTQLCDNAGRISSASKVTHLPKQATVQLLKRACPWKTSLRPSRQVTETMILSKTLSASSREKCTKFTRNEEDAVSTTLEIESTISLGAGGFERNTCEQLRANRIMYKNWETKAESK